MIEITFTKNNRGLTFYKSTVDGNEAPIACLGGVNFLLRNILGVTNDTGLFPKKVVLRAHPTVEPKANVFIPDQHSLTTVRNLSGKGSVECSSEYTGNSPNGYYYTEAEIE